MSARQLEIVPVVALLLAAAALVGCDKPQESSRVNTAKKSDARAWEGGDPAYSTTGWKAGDKASWENELRNRAQTQNEYVRVR